MLEIFSHCFRRIRCTFFTSILKDYATCTPHSTHTCCFLGETTVSCKTFDLSKTEFVYLSHKALGLLSRNFIVGCEMPPTAVEPERLPFDLTYRAQASRVNLFPKSEGCTRQVTDLWNNFHEFLEEEGEGHPIHPVLAGGILRAEGTSIPMDLQVRSHPASC